MIQALTIRQFKQSDFDNWLPLWNENNQGHENEEVTRQTWERLLDPDSHVNGLGAFDGNKLLGLLHYILHPVTGHLHPVCYMQDLFVSESHRRKGVGRALVNQLADKGRKEDWARMYWLAEADNLEAQELYKNIGVRLNFTLHILPF